MPQLKCFTWYTLDRAACTMLQQYIYTVKVNIVYIPEQRVYVQITIHS